MKKMSYQNKTREELTEELKKLQLENKRLKASSPKEMEMKLQYSEMQKNAILNAITSNIVFVDTSLKIIRVNKTAADSVNKSPDEMIGQACYNFWGNVSTVCENCPAIRAMKSKKSEEAVMHTHDGKVCEIKAEPMSDATGEIIGIVEVSNDITERMRMEDLLLQTRQNYFTFFNTVNDFLFVLDGAGNIIHANATVINRLGYKSTELTGKSVLMVHPPAHRREAQQIIEKMLEGKADFCPVPLMSKSGNLIPVETRVKQGTWNGKPAIFGVSNDISKLKLSEEKFSKMFFLSPSAAGLSDLHTGQYVEVNDAFYDLLGFEKDEVIGKTATELGILDKDQIGQIMQKADNLFYVNNIAADLKAKNGDIKHVLLLADNVVVQDKKYRFTVVHDITDLRNTETLLHNKNAELEKLNNEKDKFFSIIAHDLKNPFNSIIGFSNLLMEEAADKNFESVKNFSAIIQRSSNQAMDLLSNLMVWSHAHTGRMEYNPIYFDMAGLIDESLFLFTDAAMQKSITITKSVNPQMSVFADKHMIATVLRNLISNALKFTPKGGKINIEASIRNKEPQVSVSDNGVGITQNGLNKIFRLDENYSTAGTQKEQGTGLGLILCKEFVEKHGGKIQVESEWGKGSTFYFNIPNNKLPLRPPKTIHPSQHAVDDTILENMTILLAEDDETSELLLSASLRGFCKKIISVKNGSEAVETCRNNPDIDVVLMDIRLPLVDGLEATRQIRQFNTGIVIIAQTAIVLDDSRKKALQAGCNDFIRKPLSRKSLIEALHRHLTPR